MGRFCPFRIGPREHLRPTWRMAPPDLRGWGAFALSGSGPGSICVPPERPSPPRIFGDGTHLSHPERVEGTPASHRGNAPGRARPVAHLSLWLSAMGSFASHSRAPDARAPRWDALDPPGPGSTDICVPPRTRVGRRCALQAQCKGHLRPGPAAGGVHACASGPRWDTILTLYSFAGTHMHPANRDQWSIGSHLGSGGTQARPPGGATGVEVSHRGVSGECGHTAGVPMGTAHLSLSRRGPKSAL